MKKVMVFGTFDLLHPGHLSYFEQARKFGDFLIVVVARDKNVLKIKGRRPQDNERTRLKKVGKIKIVNKVVLGDLFDKFKAIENEKPAVICFGYDQKVGKSLLKKIEKLQIKTKRLKAFKPKIYKSSLMRQK